MLYAAVDLGGSNTDIVIAEEDGKVTGSAVLPWSPVSTAADLVDVLQRAGAPLERLTAVAVTGGRHRELPSGVALGEGDVSLVHVDELTAVGRGGLLAAGVPRALVMSLGTGTALVAAGPEGLRHLGGITMGGGVIMGLGRLLLGTTDPLEIGALAAVGDPRAVDLSVGDIIGGGVGGIPPEMTAAHFGKVGRADFDVATLRREDIAAGLMEMVGQTLTRVGLLVARAEGLDTAVLTGHLVEWEGIRRALQRMSRFFGGRVIVPDLPGLATARGALSVLVERAR